MYISLYKKNLVSTCTLCLRVDVHVYADFTCTLNTLYIALHVQNSISVFAFIVQGFHVSIEMRQGLIILMFSMFREINVGYVVPCPTHAYKYVYI